MIKKLKDKSYKNLDYLKKKSRLEVLNSKLIDCNFWESSLVKSNFFNTEILNCVFTDSNLSNSIFRDVIIKNSNFSHADISNCDFSKVKLINVNFRDAIYSKKTKWPKNYKIPREIMFELEKYNPFDYRTKLSYSNVKSLSEKKIQLYKKKFDKEEKNTLTYHSVIEKKIIHELTKGKGYYILKNFYSNKDASLAQKIIEKELKKKK